VIRETNSLQIVQLYNCQDVIQDISWSNDSDLILVASYKMATFQIWSLTNETWAAQIDEGIVGCVKVQWAPDA
jgi:hypothetical protein